MSDRKDMLEQLFDALIAQLLTKIKSGEASPGELAVARNLLKDNGIQANAEKRTDFKQLIEALDVQLDDPSILDELE